MASSEATDSEKKDEEDPFVPFVINKRPKHDVASPKPMQKETVNINVEKPNKALFENMELTANCDERNRQKDEEMESEDNVFLQCSSIRRMVAVLDYYNALMVASESDEMDTKLREEFVNFCDEHYGEQMMLEDYMHCIEHHGDRESIAKMAAALKWKCSVGSKRCGGMRRHFRDRTTSLEPIHFYEETMDTMHFNVLHLEDVGLRVHLDLDLKSKSVEIESEDGLVDGYMLKLSATIRSKRGQQFVARLDDTSKNGKFSLCSDLETAVDAEGGCTIMDRLKEGVIIRSKEDSLRKQKEAERKEKELKEEKSQAINRFKAFFSKKENEETIIENKENDTYKHEATHIIKKMRNFEKFREDEQFDSETLHEDMKVFGEEGNSNVAETLKNDEKFFILIRRMLRYLRVSGSSFSTGKWFMYWDWYQTEEGRKWVRSGGGNMELENVDFGGHSVESLCVYPHFKDLEEEVLSSGLITKEQWMKILEKATRLMKTSRCKKMICYQYYDIFHYDIPQCTPISLHHLIVLLLYTDSSAFCTAMSETFRAIFGGETIEEINKRNSRFYWSSRYLRELVTYFGGSSDYEDKPFWSGISFPLQIPQFQIGLIGPTSTSMAKEVALRFAGEQGMMIKLKGKGSRCFNAAPFSCYPEEEERIFCGSHFREELSSIVMVETGKNYKAALSAFTKFDAIFSGRKVNGLKKMSALDLEIIKESIRWIEGGEDAVNHKKLDLFILETFYSFILHKKTVYLRLREMLKFKENEIINLVMNPMWNSTDEYRWNKPKNANLLKPFVFNLFRHVHTIRIYATGHPFDFLSFLSMLQSVDLPETLRLIIIEDTGGGHVVNAARTDKWVKWAFNSVKEKYSAANIEYEMKNQYVWGNWDFLYLRIKSHEDTFGTRMNAMSTACPPSIAQMLANMCSTCDLL